MAVSAQLGQQLCKCARVCLRVHLPVFGCGCWGGSRGEGQEASCSSEVVGVSDVRSRRLRGRGPHRGPGPGGGWLALVALLPRETAPLQARAVRPGLRRGRRAELPLLGQCPGCARRVAVRAPRLSVRAPLLSVRARRVSVRPRRVQAGLAHPLCPRLPQGHSGTHRLPGSSS